MKPSPEKSPQEVLAGVVERVTYHNVENGFCVLRAKARGHRDVVTVVGHAAAIAAGEWITASGEWVNDRTHGQQFKARFLRTSPPTSADGIEKYLSSGMIRGVGPAYAKKLLRAFGEKVFDIIEASPDRLREVDGIGPVRASRITAAWAEQKAVREIMVFLHSHGVGTARAVRIYKTYGPDAIQVMTENPYRLARDIRGIGFKTADAIAMKLGIEKTALVRVRAGISYALTEAMDEGHCGLPTEELIPLAEKLLEVPQELIRTALDLELQQGTVVADRVGETPCVFLAGLHRAERTIAERLIRLANRKLPWPWIDPDKALPWIEGRIGLALAESQVAAIRLALMSKVLVMTGGPGVGKTTIVNAILRILAAKGNNILLCAPTGRAARCMREQWVSEVKQQQNLSLLLTIAGPRALPAARRRSARGPPRAGRCRARRGSAGVLRRRAPPPTAGPAHASAERLPDPEVVRQRGVDPLGGIDVAVDHPSAERLGRGMSTTLDSGRHAGRSRPGSVSLLLDPADLLHHVIEGLEVLDVDRRDDVDAGVEEGINVLQRFSWPGCRGWLLWAELVDQRHRRGSAPGTPSRSISSKRRPAVNRARTPRHHPEPPLRGAPRCGARPWVSTYPTTTSVPRLNRRRPSSSMA